MIMFLALSDIIGDWDHGNTVVVRGTIVLFAIGIQNCQFFTLVSVLASVSILLIFRDCCSFLLISVFSEKAQRMGFDAYNDYIFVPTTVPS